jgi:hypothetical protein
MIESEEVPIDGPTFPPSILPKVPNISCKFCNYEKTLRNR